MNWYFDVSSYLTLGLAIAVYRTLLSATLLQDKFCGCWSFYFVVDYLGNL